MTNKKIIFLAAVFTIATVSFFAEWIPVQKISFVTYSYFLISLYQIRCYFFCLLIIGLLILCRNGVNLMAEFFIFLPVVISGIFILCGLPFNFMMFYSRIITVLQVAALIAILVKAAVSYERQKNAMPQTASQTTPDFSKLSKREKEVAALLLEGKTNDEIAAALFVSTPTVKSHIQHIFEKYNARNRMEFAAKAREN